MQNPIINIAQFDIDFDVENTLSPSTNTHYII
jgi:hypothetical protein